jgi:hypothetical protein
MNQSILISATLDSESLKLWLFNDINLVIVVIDPAL